LPTNAIALGGSGTSRTVTVTPLPDQNGTATITLTVTDGGSASVSTAFDVKVQPVNDPPTLNPIGDLILNQGGGPQVVNLTGISSGASNENQFLVITTSSSNPALVPDPVVNYTNPASTGTLTLVPSTVAGGSVGITVTVNDGGASNNTIVRTFFITINRAPSLSDIPDQVIDEDTSTAALPFSMSDADSSVGSLTLQVASSDT